MDEYKHKEWTDETYEKVAEAIVSVIQPRPVLNMVLERTKDEKMKALINAKLEGTTSNSTSTPSDDLLSDDTGLEFESKTDSAPLEPATNTASTTSESDEYDSLFEDL